LIIFKYMRLHGILLLTLLAAAEPVFSQTPEKTRRFSLMFNSSISFSHADDPHINRWLTRYGYPTEPHIPASLNFELAAIPVSSRVLYSMKLSTIISGNNISSFNLLGGIYGSIVRTRSFLLFAGLGAGYHSEIINLNGDMPQDYKDLATQYKKQLCLRRTGLFVQPAIRAFWYGITCHQLQLGLFADLGYDLDLNSRWKLGYYQNGNHRFNRFRKISKPSDQQKVSEHGLAYNTGLSLRVHLQ
jgi:hypothetical protein